MNPKYFSEKIENSRLGSLGREILDAQTRLYFQEYEIEMLRIKAIKYREFFFGNGTLGEKLQKQEEENRDALVGEYDGFCYSSDRTRAVFRTIEDMLFDGILSESEYNKCKYV